MFRNFQRPVSLCMAVFGALGVAFSASAADADSSKVKYGVAKPLGDTFVVSPQVDGGQSLLVVYRAPNPKDQGVASLYLDDKYHVALQPNAFSLVCAESDKVDLRVRLTQPDADVAPDTRHLQPLKKGVAHYVRISAQADGRALLEAVPTRVANDELQSARQQMHTLSRAPVVRTCKPVKPANAAAPIAETNVITFGADANFRSKKADFKALTPKGKAALDQVLDKITHKYADATQVKVHLIGYADDTGDEPVNQRLAVARAQTVQTYFLQNGMRPQELNLEDRNAAQLNAAASGPSSKMKVKVEVTVTIN